MMRNLFWIQILLFTFSFNSQGQNFEFGKNKALTTKNKQLDGNLYFSHNFNDSIENPTVFLINRTESTIQFYGSSGIMNLVIEAQDEFGNWKNINNHNTECTIGNNLEYFILPKKSFTWKKIDNVFLKGDFNTQIRFLINTKDSLITSKTFQTSINHYLFLDQFERAIRVHQDYISQNQLSKKQENKVRLRIANLFSRNNKFDKALQIINDLLNQDGNNYKARYCKAKLIIRFLSKDIDKISELEKFALISEYINQLRLIPKWHEDYKEAKKMIKTYSKYLPTKTEWGQINHSDCMIIDGKYYCKVDFHINELVKINFKQE